MINRDLSIIKTSIIKYKIRISLRLIRLKISCLNSLRISYVISSVINSLCLNIWNIIKIYGQICFWKGKKFKEYLWISIQNFSKLSKLKSKWINSNFSHILICLIKIKLVQMIRNLLKWKLSTSIIFQK